MRIYKFVEHDVPPATPEFFTRSGLTPDELNNILEALNDAE